MHPQLRAAASSGAAEGPDCKASLGITEGSSGLSSWDLHQGFTLQTGEEMDELRGPCWSSGLLGRLVLLPALPLDSTRTRAESPSWKRFLPSINHHRQKELNHLRQ